MIGIVNVQWFDNPGGVWLAYSLQATVKKIKKNDEIIIIDYAAGGGRKNKKNILKKIGSFSRRVYNKLVEFSNKDMRIFNCKLKTRHKLYEQFRDEYLVRTQRFYDVNSDVLYGDYSHCIVGSDVVWKPEIADSLHSKVYFLRFLEPRVKKISYAASIGTDDIEYLNSLKDIYRELLDGFDYISVREASAKLFLEKTINQTIFQVVDPVFLLKKNEYLSLMPNDKILNTEKYLYLYLLSYDEVALNVAIDLAKENGWKIVYDLHTKENMVLRQKLKENGIPTVEVGPVEFLMLINNAEYIISNSFHGTAFSLIFQKEFLAFGRENGGVDISTRIIDLLNLLDISHRYCKSANDILGVKEINYEKIESKIEIIRNEAIEFLQRALV